MTEYVAFRIPFNRFFVCFCTIWHFKAGSIFLIWHSFFLSCTSLNNNYAIMTLKQRYLNCDLLCHSNFFFNTMTFRFVMNCFFSLNHIYFHFSLYFIPLSADLVHVFMVNIDFVRVCYLSFKPIRKKKRFSHYYTTSMFCFPNVSNSIAFF